LAQLANTGRDNRFLKKKEKKREKRKEGRKRRKGERRKDPCLKDFELRSSIILRLSEQKEKKKKKEGGKEEKEGK